MLRFIMAVALSLGLSACGDDRFPDYSYKVTVHAAGQEFTSVRHVEVTEGSIVTRRVTGEAVIIDHPNGRTYYALLARPDNADYAKFMAGMALAPHISKPAAKGEIEQALDEYDENRGVQDSFGGVAETLQAMVKIKGPRDLPRSIPGRNRRPEMEAWPMFVTFDDPADPTTVREVTPESIGVDRITIEITDENVTEGIEDNFPWWMQFSNRRFDGKSSVTEDLRSNDIRHWLTTGQFSTGDQ